MIGMPAPGASGRTLVIGTRGSALARWQAEHVARELAARVPGLVTRLQVIVTEGDRRPEGLLVDAGGKGLWVDAIEAALASGDIDLAVHSLKDVPAELRAGLVLAAFPERADPRDAIVTRGGVTLTDLPAASRVGTSSLRRSLQVRALRPDLSVEILRGNVDTRLRRVQEGAVDAAVMATAGIERLGRAEEISERMSIDRMLPAIGQGALAIETRADDDATRRAVETLDHAATATAIAAERALLAGLGAGCRTPVAGHAWFEDNRATLVLRGLVLDPRLGPAIGGEERGAPAEAATLGRRLAGRLLESGAAAILAASGAD